MMNPAKLAKTYDEYVKALSKNMEKLALCVDRLDLVFDRYFEKNLKLQTRKFRGTGNRNAAREGTPISSMFSNFMQNDQNKTELFGMVAASTAGIQCNATINGTKEEEVLSNSQIDDGMIMVLNTAKLSKNNI